MTGQTDSETPPPPSQMVGSDDIEAVGDPSAWLFHSPPERQSVERGTSTYAAAEAAFTEYFVKNYPGPDTVIYNPNWHAPKIFAAAASALRAALATATEGSGNG